MLRPFPMKTDSHHQDFSRPNLNAQDLNAKAKNIEKGIFDSGSTPGLAPHSLPDVAKTSVAEALSGELNWVGMENILLPLRIQDSAEDSAQSSDQRSSREIAKTEASISAFVNLISPEARGIHMSRLYAMIQEGFAKNLFSVSLLKEIAAGFLQSHEGLSNLAKIEVSFSAMVQRKALKTNHRAWRTYPVKYKLEATSTKEFTLSLSTQVLYSSTCPASAALSRRLIQENFGSRYVDETSLLSKRQVMEFLEDSEGINATPHAQRSLANVEVQLEIGASGQSGSLERSEKWDHLQLINLIEATLKTPVQTIVKREDEQEFARLNAANLMFCEDAARRIQNALGQHSELIGFSGKVSHEESLHPHNAVAYFKKGKSDV